MSKPNLFRYASEIRKEGESWKDAQERAKKILSSEAKPPKETEPKTVKTEKVNSSIRQENETTQQFLTRQRYQ